jgi:capsular exopolysaccharide synthesis family protein
MLWQATHGSAQQPAVPIGPAQQAQAGGGLELSHLLRILTERYKLIIGAGVLGLIIGIIASLAMTELYRATALIEINSQTTDMLDSVSGRSQQAPRGSSQEMMSTQIGLLRSETLARRVVEDLNLAGDPAFGGNAGSRQQRTDRATAVVSSGAMAEPLRNSMLIKVSYVSTKPELAAKVANGLAEGYIASSLERRYDSSSYARKFLSDQIARTKTALEDSERALNTYSIESSIFRTPGEVVDGKVTEGVTLATSDLAALNDALNVARVKRIATEHAFQNARVDFQSDQTAGTSSLVQQRAELQAQYDERSKLFKPDYPQMRELQTRIGRLESAIATERSRSSGNKRSELRGEYEAAQRIEAELTGKVAAAKGTVQSERTRSIQYGILQREADTNRALYDALLQKYKEVGVAGGIGQSNVALVDAAEPPGGAFRPNIPLNALSGLVLGLALGVGLAFALHLLFDAITDPADVRNKLHLPVLGVIPLENADRTLLEALADRKSDVSEAYYSVRTALKFSRPEGAPKTMLVTSTRPGEGKSTSAYAIASSMARIGSKVLLIDADLRKPTFVSSREDGYGLAHLLGSEEPVKDYVEKTQVENLSLLPVGRFVGSAAELLSSNRLPAIIAEAGHDFEMVLIDGPPVLGLTDAPLLGAAAEATVLVIESGQSRTGNVSEMVRRLHEAGARIIGVILTKVTAGNNSYGYSYYSYNYGSDGVGGRVSSDPTRVLDVSRQEA